MINKQIIIDMKRSLFIIATAALIVGCASNDVKDDIVNQEIPIGFSNINVGKKTKANAGEINSKTALEQDGNTMKVWGWKTYNNTPTKVFDGTTVTYNSSSSQSTTNWEYSPLKYWDFAASYDFYAVAPHSKFSINETTKIISASSVEAVQILADNNGTDKVTSSTAIDYLVAATVHKDAPKGNASDGDVEFTFSHILSKLAVKVKTTDSFANEGSNYPQIKLTDLSIKLQGMCPSYTQKTAGAVNSSSTDGDTWSGTAMAATSYTCFDADGTTVTDLLLNATANEIASYLVAPTATGATPATYTYTATVEYDIYYSATANDKEHFVATDKQISTLTKFGQNTSNTLTITIDPQALFFDVKTLNDWTNGLDGTLTVE